MIEHPMERGRAYDSIEHALERQAEEIACNQMKSRVRRCTKMLLCTVQHILRKIDSDYTTSWEPGNQLTGKATCAATRVQHEFIAAKPQACQNFLAPTGLRRRDLMVDSGIPFASRRWLR